jgi:protein-disulfide isomerase
MIKRARGLMSAALAAAVIMVSPLTASALDDAEKEEIGQFIREYLIQNPEILFEVQAAYEAKQQIAQREQARQVIAQSREAIFNSPADIVLGNPQGDVTIVEFFDYNCGYCKRAMKDMEEIIANDPNVRFVLKEFPILGEDSVAAHRVSMALKRIAPDKYEEFHLGLLGGHERATEASAMELAKALGVDENALRTTMADESITESFREAYRLADGLGISGTPSYIVGDEAVFGAVGMPTLMGKVTNLRDCESATC